MYVSTVLRPIILVREVLVVDYYVLFHSVAVHYVPQDLIVPPLAALFSLLPQSPNLLSYHQYIFFIFCMAFILLLFLQLPLTAQGVMLLLVLMTALLKYGRRKQLSAWLAAGAMK